MDVASVLLPTTDGGVAVQVGAVLLLGGVGLWAARERPHWRTLVVGVVMVLMALAGLRAAH